MEDDEVFVSHRGEDCLDLLHKRIQPCSNGLRTGCIGFSIGWVGKHKFVLDSSYQHFGVQWIKPDMRIETGVTVIGIMVMVVFGMRFFVWFMF